MRRPYDGDNIDDDALNRIGYRPIPPLPPDRPVRG